MKAVVLLSGGLDSATCLYWAKTNGYRPFCLIFDYGQRHRKEIKCAIKVAKKCKVPFRVVRFNLPWGGSALVDKKQALPQGRNLKEMTSGKIPATYVPARNTIFLSFAFSFADAMDAGAIVIGANAVDFSGYPDCRPEYMKSMQRAADLGTKRGTQGRKIRILYPLIRMSKPRIVHLGYQLKVPYGLTWSCYRGGKAPCRKCDSCILRAKGFKEAGKADPLITGE